MEINNRANDNRVDTGLSRRRFLAASGAVTATGIAGCLGIGTGGDGGSGPEGDGGSGGGGDGGGGDGGTTADENEFSISVSEELSLPVDDPLGVTIWGENLVVTDGSAGSENVVVLDGKSETVSKRGTIAVDGGSPSLTGTAVEGGREGAFILRALEQSTGEAHEYSLEGDSQGGSVAMPGMTLKGLSFDPFALWMVASRDGEPDGFYRVDKSTGEPMTKGKGPSSPDALDVPGGTGWGIVYVEDAVWVCNPEQGKFHGYLWDIATAGDNGNELGSFSVPWDARGSTYDGELIWSVDVATGTLKGFEPPR